jgi:anti-sigma B factor antagonist
VNTEIELEPGDAGDDCSVIAVTGELDLSAASKFARTLSRAAASPPEGLMVDLSNCSFIDSTGVSLLLNASRRQTRAREGLAIVCPNPTPFRVFEITGTLATLNVVADRAAGRDAIERSRQALSQASE